MSEILTASRLKAFRQCQRLHKYRYGQCRQSIGVIGVVQFGVMFHAALEAWWLGYQLSSADRFFVAEAAINAFPDVSDEDRVIARELLRGYHLRWHEEPLITLSAEERFETPLLNPETGEAHPHYVLGGKIDALVTDSRNGRQYLVEHKTTGADISDGSSYWKRLRMDGQISSYYSAFPEVAGCLYDVIRRPLQKRYKATPAHARRYTGKGALHAAQREDDEPLDEFADRLREAIGADPDGHYKRGVVVRLERELAEHAHDVWIQAYLMEQMEHAGFAPRNPDGCMQYGRLCEYFDVCTGAASIEDERLYRIRPQNPELMEVAL